VELNFIPSLPHTLWKFAPSQLFSRSRLRSFSALAASLVLLAVGRAAEAKRTVPPASTGLRAIALGRPAPDFSFDLGSGSERLSALAGRAVVLNFWATWCGPCRDELDAFEALRDTYGDAVTLLTISREQPGVARAFLAAHHLDLPLVEDPAGKIFAAYSISPLPVTIVLRPGGAVSYVMVGELDESELHGAIDAALAVTPAASSAPRP